MEAGGFQTRTEEIAATDPFPFSYLVVLFEGRDAGVPVADDAAYWADLTGLDAPVLADPTQTFTEKMPYQGAIPARCALSPRMEMIACYTGDAPPAPAPDPALEAIREHWEANGD